MLEINPEATLEMDCGAYEFGISIFASFTLVLPVCDKIDPFFIPETTNKSGLKMSTVWTESDPTATEDRISNAHSFVVKTPINDQSRGLYTYNHKIFYR